MSSAPAWPRAAPVWIGLAAATGLSWLYLWTLARDMDESMPGMADMVMPHLGPWSLADFALTFVMWAAMMVAMMLPSAAPTVALFRSVERKRRPAGASLPAVNAFTAGYLAVWAGFSVGAVALQWMLDRAALLTMDLTGASPYLVGGFLLAAGVYQFLPLKRACLVQCRSPLGFLMAHWRDGAAGAFRMGVAHGVRCLGCCAALMLLLFVGGAMNLVWVAAVALLVAIEKLMPRGERIAAAFGIVFLAAGAVTLLRPLLG